MLAQLNTVVPAPSVVLTGGVSFLDLAFQHKGREGEQRTLDRGSAGKSKHQQYFTPQWAV